MALKTKTYFCYESNSIITRIFCRGLTIWHSNTITKCENNPFHQSLSDVPNRTIISIIKASPAAVKSRSKES